MIEYLEHHIVDHCNLKCGGCSHFSPIADEWFESIEDFTKDFTELAKKTEGKVGVIRLMGGEPLLHPKVEDFLKITRNLFPNSQIQIVTNGLLIHKLGEIFKEVCNDYNILVCVSNYGLNLDLREILNGFKLTRIDAKGELYNISLNLSGNQDIQRAFSGCDLHIYHWFYFQYGKFYPCCIGANIKYFMKKFPNTIELTDDELEQMSVSIYDHSLDEVLNFLNKPVPLCRYCDTNLRQRSYHPFSISKGDIKEWICQ